MSKTLEFLFDVGSATSYLAWTQLPDLVQRQHANLVWRPILLGGVFKATGNVSPASVKAKGAYMFRDLERCAEQFGVPYRLNSHFPINTLALMRGAVAAQIDNQLERYLDVVFPAIWVKGLNMGDPEVTGNTLAAGGFDPAEFAQRIQSDEVKQALKDNTFQAVERGVFGAPTFFVGDEMFFGQDRLDFVEMELANGQ